MTKRAQMSREKPSTIKNSQTMRMTPGSSVNSTSKHLERFDRLRPDLTHSALHGCIAAGVTLLAQLAPQPYGGEAGIGRQALVQIWQEGIGAPRLRWPRAVGGRFQAAFDVSADRLAIQAELGAIAETFSPCR
jgi:hypothetical protein